jgi:N-acetylglucosamine-6-sulfatase
MMSVTTIVLILATIACAIVPSDQSDQRPNILLLLTDDQDLLLGGTNDMPFYIKHLVNQGTTFRNYFVHTPVCCPSRTSILTGRYLHNGGALNNSFPGNCYGAPWRAKAEYATFAVYAKQAGYHTGYAGKYLNEYATDGTTLVPPGWDKWFGLVGNSEYYGYDVIRSDTGGPNGTKYHHGGNYHLDYFSDRVANRTMDMIREFTSSSSVDRIPFLIVNSWPAPHYPYTPAPWSDNLFPNSSAPRTPSWNESSTYTHQKHWIMRQLSPLDQSIVQQIDDIHRLRTQTLQSVDRHIDQFVRLMTDQGILNNTIIIYTSDNGWNAGQHRLPFDKRHLYEHNIRVPFVVRGPNVPKNVAVSDIVVNVDIAPTIYQLVQPQTKGAINQSVPILNTMDGIPFLPVVPDNVIGKQFRRHDFLITYHGEGKDPCGLVTCPTPPSNDFHTIDSFNNSYNCIRSIVTSNGIDFIYCRFDDDENFTEYYDTNTDPWQLHNQAHNLSKARVSQLDQRLNVLKTCQGITCRQ